ncbi:MAG: arylsulfatase [Pirellulales bacterium]|nr:arylsulfatase [Pirellulales bacterium]
MFCKSNQSDRNTTDATGARLRYRIATHIAVAIWLGLSIQTAVCGQVQHEGSVPNIVLILADDMGYGDVRAMNAESTVPTPSLDRLAADGMTFTDAHSPSAVCTPTRYGLLTGRYCWRSTLKRGVLGGYSPPLIDPERMTVGKLLQDAGYHTAAVGKWHLGMDMPERSGTKVEIDRREGDGNVDFAGTIKHGPTTRGFDHYFGISASLDMAPYVWIEDDRFTMVPDKQQPAQRFPGFISRGPRSSDFMIDEVLDRIADQASGYIRERASSGQPFFLYLPLTAPHKPVTPHERFAGTTELGPYADFIAQVDNTVGRVLKSVDDAGARENTLVIFTSDNGSFMRRLETTDARDHADDESIQAYRADRHRPNAMFRGTKADVWEAGHRVPFFARWPGVIESGSRCERTITHTDFFATAAEMIGSPLEDNMAEDSFSWLPLFRQDESAPSRAPIINHSIDGMFAIRDGQWKLVLGNGSGGRQQPKGKPFEQPYQLFDLTVDPGESLNVAANHPEIVEAMTKRFHQIQNAGRSR